MPGKRETRAEPAPPRRPLRALVVEDVEIDAQLLLRELARAGFAVDWKRVDNARDMEQALLEPWDIVLSDWNMPGFNAKAALALVKARGIDVPFVIVSGTVEEEIAVEALHAGAQDFFFKGKLLRLGAAVDRELKEVAIRSERRTLQEQLLLSDRMVSVGTLAAGVAHEINNPLAALMANVEFANRRSSSGSSLRHRPTCARASPKCRRRSTTRTSRPTACGYIVRDVKVFSRPDEERRGPVHVHRVLESTSRMCWNEIRHRARLVKDFAPVGHVMGERGPARPGLPEPDGQRRAGDPRRRGGLERDPGRDAGRRSGQVVIEVRDTGSGISPELARRGSSIRSSPRSRSVPERGSGWRSANGSSRRWADRSPSRAGSGKARASASCSPRSRRRPRTRTPRSPGPRHSRASAHPRRRRRVERGLGRPPDPLRPARDHRRHERQGSARCSSAAGRASTSFSAT